MRQILTAKVILLESYGPNAHKQTHTGDQLRYPNHIKTRIGLVLSA